MSEDEFSLTEDDLNVIERIAKRFGMSVEQLKSFNQASRRDRRAMLESRQVYGVIEPSLGMVHRDIERGRVECRTLGEYFSLARNVENSYEPRRDIITGLNKIRKFNERDKKGEKSQENVRLADFYFRKAMTKSAESDAPCRIVNRIYFGMLTAKVLSNEDLTPDELVEFAKQNAQTRPGETEPITPENYNPVFLLSHVGITLKKAMKFDSAAEQFQKAAELCTKRGVAYQRNRVKYGICKAHLGDYEEARKVFEEFFDIKNPRLFRTQIGSMMENFMKISTGSADRSLNLFLETVMAIAGVYGSGNGEDKRHLKASLDRLIRSIEHSTPEQFRPFVNNLRNYEALHTEPLETLQEGRTKNKVFRAGDFVYKVSGEAKIEDELDILRSFRKSLSKLERISQGTTESQKLPVRPPLRLAEELNLVKPVQRYVVPPAHIRAEFGEDASLVCYGHISGPTLREFLKDADEETRTEAYTKTIDQLALLHALGPLHFREIPIVKTHDSTYYVTHLEKKMEAYEEQVVKETVKGNEATSGFDDADIQEAIYSYRAVAEHMSAGQVDSYVKDANPFNWIVVEDAQDNPDTDKITAIDFETYAITSPNYDLVKLMEHFGDKSQEDSHFFLRYYAIKYNQNIEEFNSGMPYIHQKDKIENIDRFIFNFECYVIDHCLKSFHNKNYTETEFDEQKLFWMRRGQQAVEYLMSAGRKERDQLEERLTAEERFEQIAEAALGPGAIEVDMDEVLRAMEEYESLEGTPEDPSFQLGPDDALPYPMYPLPGNPEDPEARARYHRMLEELMGSEDPLPPEQDGEWSIVKSSDSFSVKYTANEIEKLFRLHKLFRKYERRMDDKIKRAA